MATTQTVNYFPNVRASPAYSFLSKPPPQKKRPTQPLPPTPRLRSNPLSSIAYWATQVQPGSPAPRSPRSPRRRSSISRRPSITSRRTSISISPSTTASFLHVIHTPTSATHSIKDFDFDLTTLGYTSVFVHLPKTPTTPPTYLRAAAEKSKSNSKSTEQPPSPMSHINPNSFPIPPPPTPPPRTPKRFRSLSILRPRSRSTTKSTPPSPTKSLSHSSARAAAIAKRKKSAYANSTKISAKYSTSAPVPLANELALMQLMDGGSTDRNIQRLMEAQAKAAAGTRSGDGTLAVGDVYRDGKGGIWRDRDEELEYAHLLGGGGDGDCDSYEWVTFGEEMKVKDGDVVMGDASLALASLAGLGRRDSSTSTKTVDSDCDPANVVKHADEDAGMMHMHVPGLIHHHYIPTTAVPKSPSQPTTTHPILSIPTRTTRPHLRKNPQFVLDLAAFPPSLPSLTSPHLCTPHTPLTPAPAPAPAPAPGYKRTSPVRTSFTVGAGSPRLRGKARRRPAPLKLVGVPRADVSSEDVIVEQGRRDFLDASFAPAPLPLGLAPPPSFYTKPVFRGLKKKTSRMGFAFFGRKE